jgi:TrmH family RNA methyltransferase
MISRAQVKEIRELAAAKGREAAGLYLAEGDKIVREWLMSRVRIRYIAATEEWLRANGSLADQHPEATVLLSRADDLERISTQKHPNGALVVAEIPPPAKELPKNCWCLALDMIQDPGNLGTIIRNADWFGVEHIVCSPGTADAWNPKVVAAAMGGHLRVQIHRAELPPFLRSCGTPVLAASLQGKDIREAIPYAAAALIIGNESKGISPEVVGCASSLVRIPGRGAAESLNAAVASGILLSMLVSG